jgi:hypothetical protein
MVVVPTRRPDGWNVRADGAASAEIAEGMSVMVRGLYFQTARDADRLAELVAYTLLGAAINGFAPR